MNTNDPGREPTDAELERRFEQWWADEGSGMAPRDLEEHYSHAERVSRIAWMNGAFLASGARPMPKSRNRPPLTDLDLSAIKRMVLAAKAWYAPELGEECEHGHLARKCETCQLIAAEARVAELNESIRFWQTNATNTYRDNTALTARVAELEAELAEANGRAESMIVSCVGCNTKIDLSARSYVCWMCRYDGKDDVDAE